MDAHTLTEAEVRERAALLRRFKALLEEKRAKFRAYLAALEAQEKSIAGGDMLRVEQQADLGDAIVAELYTIQKVIDPVEAMYREIQRSGSAAGGSEPLIPKLQADLHKLQDDIVRQNEKNRELLRTSMGEVHAEITALRKPMRRKNVYAAESGNASVIDIRT